MRQRVRGVAQCVFQVAVGEMGVEIAGLVPEKGIQQRERLVDTAVRRERTGGFRDREPREVVAVRTEVLRSQIGIPRLQGLGA